MPAGRQIATWGAFVFGLLVIPLVVLALGGAVRNWSEGADLTGEDGVALIGARDLAAAVDRYLGHYQHVPDPKQGLNALVPEFLEYVPNDPWNNPYVYESTGPNWADVLSYGADGRAGGGGDGADISARFGRLGGHAPGYLRPLFTLVVAALALAAALSAKKRPWCGFALGGMSVFWGMALLVTASPPQAATLRLATLPVLSFATGLACLVGAIALLRELPGAPRLALTSVVSAFILLQYLVAT